MKLKAQLMVCADDRSEEQVQEVVTLLCACLCYPCNSSSNVLASWRSAVSNPSVNQP